MSEGILHPPLQSRSRFRFTTGDSVQSEGLGPKLGPGLGVGRRYLREMRLHGSVKRRLLAGDKVVTRTLLENMGWHALRVTYFLLVVSPSKPYPTRDHTTPEGVLVLFPNVLQSAQSQLFVRTCRSCAIHLIKKKEKK